MAKAGKQTTDENKDGAKANPFKQRAEFKYIGDDGGRWLFERRSDGLAITIDKPRHVILDAKSPPTTCLLTVRGRKFNDDILSMVKK